MNKKIFSGKLMLEGMRQVMLPGVIGLLLIVGASFFSSFVEVANMVSYSNMYELGCSFSQLNSYIQLVMFIASPLMTLMLFGFMNRRCASDFYHSLAYTRLCMYLSFVAAVLLWCILMIVAGSITTLLVCVFSGKINIETSTIAYPVMSAVAGVVIMTGVTALAMTLTGTYLTNVFTAVIFLFAPRGLMLFCRKLLVSSMPYVVLSDNSFFSKLLNIPFDILTEVVGVSQNANYILTSWIPAAYTAAVGLILIGIGAACFILRKSENATMASINRVLQGIFRIIPAVLISLIAISFLFDAHKSKSPMSDSDKFVVIMTYIGVVVIYFLYEVVTTRHIRNFVKIIPGLAIVAAINFAIYFALTSSYDYNMNLAPDKDEIAYVVVHGPDNSILWKDSENMKLYSDSVRSVASECLKDTITMWNEDISAFYQGNKTVIEYHLLDGSSILRKVRVTDARYAQLKNVLFNDGEFAGSFGKSLYNPGNINCNVGDLDSDDSKMVYNVFLAELKESGRGKLFDLVNENRMTSTAFTSINLWKNEKQDYFYTDIYIGADMPKTAAAYMNVTNEKKSGNAFEKAVELVESVQDMVGQEYDSSAYINGTLTLTVYKIKNDGTMNVFNSYTSMSYTGGDYGYVPSEETVAEIKKLGNMLKVRQIGTYDIAPGAILLNVVYYENRNVDTVWESTASGEVQIVTQTVMTDNAISKWYIINDDIYEIIKNISADSGMQIEK